MARLRQGTDSGSRWLLVLSAIVTVIGWQFEVGRMLLYPFTILATYAHEMGHGLTAVVLGASFEALEIFPDGSGLAHWRGDLGRFGRATVALGGLVGPSIVGAIVLVLSRRAALARWILLAISSAMLASAIVVVRSLFGVVFVVAVAGLLALSAYYGGRRWAPLLVQFIGVQLCLSVFRDLRYMFSGGAVIDGATRLSDSGAIAEALFLPYWVWGAVAAFVSFSAIGLGLKVALRGGPVPSDAGPTQGADRPSA